MESYPTIKWIREQMRFNLVSRVRYKILDAYIIGSEALGTAKQKSDIDIAVIIPPVHGKSSLKVSEKYHEKFTANWQMPHWNERRIDIQFFYPDEIKKMKYKFIPLLKK